MRRIILWILVLVMTVGSAACDSLFLGRDPSHSPEANFDALWTEFDRLYALFELKGVDWDAQYLTHRPGVHDGTSERDLFAAMRDLLRPLDDGHVVLRSPGNVFIASERHLTTRKNYDAEVVRHYLGDTRGTTASGRIDYGWLDDRIGYVRIDNFSGEEGGSSFVSRWTAEMDPVVAAFDGATGLVIDVRANSGGNGFDAQNVAGRFADRRRPFMTSRTRNGPLRSDFSDPHIWYVEPTGPRQFTGPIVLLISRTTFSAGEWFVLAMRSLPHVTVVGDSTGGAFSQRLSRELPNGWVYSISIQQVTDPAGNSYEGVGVPPDQYVVFSPGDAANRRDPLLDAALARLRELQ